MKILITGAVGFLGFSLADKLLKKTNFKIYGIDNLNQYYSPKLKKKRLNILKSRKNFSFFKIDLKHKEKINNLFKKIKFDMVFHFAAQAGVRYTVSHPEEFVKNNIDGFFNLLDCLKFSKVDKFFYASSSSVYGNLKKFPVNEKADLKPRNIYGLSKKFNEELIKLYSNNKIKFIGLRFFTVYGEWGRPDMLILKFLNCAKKKKTFYLNNSGNHWRDFTYIEDVINILIKLMRKHFKSNEIFNICSSRPVHVGQVVNYISKKINFKKVNIVKKYDFEVLKTHGSNKKVNNYVNYKKYSNLYKNIDKIIDWHEKNYKFI